MSWEEYYKKLQNSPPRPLLLKALGFCDAKRNDLCAIDLGSGTGRDTLHLLENGWTVAAVEREAKGVELLKNSLSSDAAECLSIIQSSFEDLSELPKSDLVYASFSLPFCKPEYFPKFWKVLMSSTKSNSILAANFFGPDDDWVKNGELCAHSEQEIIQLLENFKILDWHEQNGHGKTATGPDKNWHVFTVIAQVLDQ
jgi:tellurite methyltransferase